MRRIFTVLAVFLMAGTFAFAQATPTKQTATKKAPKAAAAAPKAMKAMGSVVSADASTLTLKAKASEEKFALGADTKIKVDGKDATAADLAAGQTATVTYTKSGDTMTATQVVAKAKAAPKAKAKTPKTPKK
jgi:hypothetical protein